MLKLVSTMARVTAAVGVLAVLPRIATIQRNVLERANAAAAHGEGDNSPLHSSSDALGLLNGQTPSLPGLDWMGPITGLMGLPSGDSAGPSQPKSAPAQPAMVIYRTGPDASRGKPAGIAVMRLPPGANATFVDGRLQLYYSVGKAQNAR
jgi:hypothetical protein